MLIHSKINIFIRKFLLDQLHINKKIVDKLLETWDSKKNQDLLKEKFQSLDKPKKKNVNKWNKFYKDNYKKIKKELGKGAERKDILAELSKRWKKEKEKDKENKRETAIINFEPIVEFPELIIPPDSSLHRLLTEILKTGKPVDTPAELPTSPKSKKDLEEEENSADPKAYDSFCEANIDRIKEENPEFTYDKITKILAKMWRGLSQEEKNKWNKD